MAGIIAGIMIGLMGLVWLMQPKGGPGDNSRSKVVIVDDMPAEPVVCKPVQTDENVPLIRNLTQRYEDRRYLLKPGEECTPE